MFHCLHNDIISLLCLNNNITDLLYRNIAHFTIAGEVKIQELNKIHDKHGGDKKHLLQIVLSVSNRKGYSYVGTSQAQHISLGIVWSSCPPSAEGH